MNYSRLFLIISIGSIGYCLTSTPVNEGDEKSQKTCYVYKKKQIASDSNEVKESQD